VPKTSRLRVSGGHPSWYVKNFLMIWHPHGTPGRCLGSFVIGQLAKGRLTGVQYLLFVSSVAAADCLRSHQTEDFAIVARFNDATTDGPVVVIAGIGSNGTQAAGEFIVSPDALDALARTAPHNSLNQNFEAVLKVEVVGENTGAATIVASQFW